MRALGRVLRRDGASRLGEYFGISKARSLRRDVYVESWAEHLRQHARFTGNDKATSRIMRRSFHLGPGITRGRSYLIRKHSKEFVVVLYESSTLLKPPTATYCRSRPSPHAVLQTSVATPFMQ